MGSLYWVYIIIIMEDDLLQWSPLILIRSRAGRKQNSSREDRKWDGENSWCSASNLHFHWLIWSLSRLLLCLHWRQVLCPDLIIIYYCVVTKLCSTLFETGLSILGPRLRERIIWHTSYIWFTEKCVKTFQQISWPRKESLNLKSRFSDFESQNYFLISANSEATLLESYPIVMKF